MTRTQTTMKPAILRGRVAMTNAKEALTGKVALKASQTELWASTRETEKQREKGSVNFGRSTNTLMSRCLDTYIQKASSLWIPIPTLTLPN